MEENNIDVLTEIIDIADDIRVIKRWVTFFGVLTLVGLISSLLVTLLGFLGFIKIFSGIF